MITISVSSPPPMNMESPLVAYRGVQRGSGRAGYAARYHERAARGDVAEWLGRGLQSLVQRFESARRLSSCRSKG